MQQPGRSDNAAQAVQVFKDVVQLQALKAQLADATARRDAMAQHLAANPLSANPAPRERIAFQQLQTDLRAAELEVNVTQARITALTAEQAAARAAEAQAAARAAAPRIASTSPAPFAPPTRLVISDEVMIISGVFTVFVLAPLAIALAVRLVRRGSTMNTAQLTDMAERVRRIENAVETMAVEVERVSEGQRFLSRSLSDPEKKKV